VHGIKAPKAAPVAPSVSRIPAVGTCGFAVHEELSTGAAPLSVTVPAIEKLLTS
jgi:hypothetical protein